MTLANKNILLISPEPWDHIFISKHHYATWLAKKNNNIFFLGPPSKSWSVSTTKYLNVYSVTYPGFPSGQRFFPKFLQHYFIKKNFNKIQVLIDSEIDIVWSFDNSVFYDFSALPERILKISHIVDLNQNFQTGIAARTATICLCTTEHIKERLLKYNSRVFKIGHGFNHKGTDERPHILPGKSKIKALYSGNLGMPYIDWNILHGITSNHTEVDFVFVGPNKDLDARDQLQNESKRQVLQLTNCFFVGQVDSHQLINYYKAADILLIVYQQSNHQDQANPHKMVEYLGSGKAIVASYTEEYSELSEGVILMKRKNNEMNTLFFSTIRNLDALNSYEMQERRKAYAMTRTYDKLIDQIEQILS